MLYINQKPESSRGPSEPTGGAPHRRSCPSSRTLRRRRRGICPLSASTGWSWGWIAEVSQGTIPEPGQPSEEGTGGGGPGKAGRAAGGMRLDPGAGRPHRRRRPGDYRVYRQALRDIPGRRASLRDQWPAGQWASRRTRSRGHGV